MKFLIDAQLPPAFAGWLRDRGHEAQHVQDVGLHTAEDTRIRNYAFRAGAIIITKDEDFASRAAVQASGPVIVWLRVGNSTNRNLFAWFEPRWPQVVTMLDRGQSLVEVV